MLKTKKFRYRGNRCQTETIFNNIVSPKLIDQPTIPWKHPASAFIFNGARVSPIANHSLHRP